MDISVILCTYNRCDLLPIALQALAGQKTEGVEYEIIVVDNNSTDRTKEVVAQFVKADSHFRYLFEPKQGLSNARNAGIAAAEADLMIFTDDDVEVSDRWIQQNFEAGQRFPDADYFGGQVLPIWEGKVPAWISNSVNPLAIQTPGDKPLKYTWDDPQCLVGASLAVRRSAFGKAGLFDVRTQRVKGGIGSTEDHDWEKKVWDAGGHGMYVPEILCYTKIPPDRLKKSYHRRWHIGNGKFLAISCNSEYESPRRFCGVPLYAYRKAVETLGEFAMAHLKRQDNTFWIETKLWFFFGYIRQKWKGFLRPQQGSTQQAGSFNNS